MNPPQIEAVGRAVAWVAVTLLLVVGAHRVSERPSGIRGPIPRPSPAATLVTVALAGAALVWRIAGGDAARAGGAGWLFPLAVVALYGAGIVTYVEARFVLSRGYSLRILADLVARGGAAPVSALKTEYGTVGVSGLVTRRLESLARAGLVRTHGATVGPPTPLGAALAVIGGLMRRLLCLEQVG